MHLIVGARGLLGLGDKGTHRASGVAAKVGITLTWDPWMHETDLVFLHV